MANKLKIYACSGLGKKKTNSGYTFWTDGYNTLDNTQAVNSLLAKINLCRSALQNLRTATQAERVATANELVLYAVCLHFVRQYADDKDALQKVGAAISVLCSKGVFNRELALKDTEQSAIQAIASVNELLDSGVPEEQTTKSFIEWWDKNVLKLDKIGLAETKRKAVKKAFADIKKVGETKPTWDEDKNIGELLTNAGENFLYLYFTDEQIAKLPHIFGFRRKKQLDVYDYCKTLFVKVYGTEEDMQNIIRAGIIGYFGEQPEMVCDTICNDANKQKQEISGGGAAAAAALSAAEIVTIITTVLGFVGGVIAAICQMVADSKVAENKSIDKAAIEASTPNPEDYEGMNFGDVLTGVETPSWLPFALLAVGAYIILK